MQSVFHTQMVGKERKLNKLLINDVILTCAVIILSLGAYAVFALLFERPSGNRIEVYRDGEYVYEFLLSEDGEHVLTEDGYTVRVSDGRATVLKTYCNDRSCTSMSVNSNGGEIICLPNRLVIRHSRNNKHSSADITAG